VSDPGNFGTVIGQGSLLEGTLLIDHGIRVDGTFRGRVTTPTALLVNDGGEVESDLVEVGAAEIHGTVVGTIRARTGCESAPRRASTVASRHRGSSSRKGP
jgi:cytoskeletal protein CcmA (bactofilin family)